MASHSRHAQGSTPTAAASRPGIIGTVLGSLPVNATEALWTVRLAFGAGAGLPYWTHSGPMTVYVESGRLGLTAVAGRALIGPQTPAEMPHLATLGEETLLSATRSASVAKGVEHSIRNAGPGDAVVILTVIGAPDRVPYLGAKTSEQQTVVFPAYAS